jgi:long-chain acyl-CoA synthetase
VILGLGSANIRDRIIERFGVQHVAECFGSTDAGVVTITPLGKAPREGSAGPPVKGVSLRIVDDEGNALPIRGVGEITVHTPHCMAEYFHDPSRRR